MATSSGASGTVTIGASSGHRSSAVRMRRSSSTGTSVRASDRDSGRGISARLRRSRAGVAGRVLKGDVGGTTGVASRAFTRSPRSRSSMGFLRKPWIGALASLAGSTGSSTPAIRAMGMSAVSSMARSRWSRVQPSMPGMAVSTRATSNRSPRANRSRASAAESTHTSSMSVGASRDSAMRWMLGLSSTRRRRDIGYLGKPGGRKSAAHNATRNI